MHWTQQRERASIAGIAFLIGVMKLTGPWVVKQLVVPVALYYFLFSPKTRKASGDYLLRMRQFAKVKGVSIDLPGRYLRWLTFRHLLSFARSMVDRVHAWSAGFEAVNYQIEGQELLDDVLYNDRQGALLLVSHLGNFDLAIARSENTPKKNFNIVMNTSHASEYNQFRNGIFESEHVRFIEPASVTPLEIISLIKRAANGEVVVIAADRTINANDKSNVLVDFCGDQAAFPSGPYIMAHLLEVPVYCLFALQKRGGCLIRFEMFEQKVIIPRKQRSLSLRKYAQKFADRLESECLNFPLQWYNFYDFWGKSASGDAKGERLAAERKCDSAKARQIEP